MYRAKDPKALCQIGSIHLFESSILTSVARSYISYMYHCTCTCMLKACTYKIKNLYRTYVSKTYLDFRKYSTITRPFWQLLLYKSYPKKYVYNNIEPNKVCTILGFLSHGEGDGAQYIVYISKTENVII